MHAIQTTATHLARGLLGLSLQRVLDQRPQVGLAIVSVAAITHEPVLAVGQRNIASVITGVAAALGVVNL